MRTRWQARSSFRCFRTEYRCTDTPQRAHCLRKAVAAAPRGLRASPPTKAPAVPSARLPAASKRQERLAKGSQRRVVCTLAVIPYFAECICSRVRAPENAQVDPRLCCAGTRLQQRADCVRFLTAHSCTQKPIWHQCKYASVHGSRLKQLARAITWKWPETEWIICFAEQVWSVQVCVTLPSDGLDPEKRPQGSHRVEATRRLPKQFAESAGVRQWA